ncbi:MAG: CocE/NonD family hydrolase [Steroidobacteraceae bacterium]
MVKCLIAWVLLCCVAAPVLAAEDLDFRAPAAPDGPLTAAALRSLAVRALPVYKNPDRTQFLANLSALQMVAGDYVAANATRESLDALRRRTNSGPAIDLAIVYDLYARARAMEVKDHGTFERSFAQVFRQSVSPLHDLDAFTVTRWLATPLGVFRSNFENELDRVRGERRITLSQAVDLVWAYLSFDAFRSFNAVAAPLIADDDRRRYVIDDRVLVRTPRRASISAVLVRPRNAPALPTLLQFTTYVGSNYDAMDCAAHGYAGVIAYARGRASSPDALVPYEHDGDDARAVIAWIARQTWSNRSVGMYGSGYSGFAAWAAAKRPSPALKALAAASPLAPGLDASQSLRVPGLAASIYRRWLRHPSFDRYWQEMLPYREDFAHIEIPVLATTGYYDAREPDAMYFFTESLRRNLQANQTLLIGPYDDQAMRRGPVGVLGGYSLDRAALVNLKALRFQWFDHVLKNGPQPGLLAARVNFQVMGANTWGHAASLDQMANGAVRLYLDPNRAGGHFRLSGHSPSKKRFIELEIPLEESGSAPSSAAKSGATEAGAGAGAAAPAPADIVSREIASADSVTFVSGPLDRPMVMSGSVSGLLSFATNQRRLGIDLTLYELLPGGEYFKLFAPPDVFDLLEVPVHGRPRAIVPKRRERFPFRGERVTSVELKSGARLVLVLAVHSPPVDAAKRSALEVRWYGGSYIELPVDRGEQAREVARPAARPAAKPPVKPAVRPPARPPVRQRAQPGGGPPAQPPRGD